MVHTSPSPVFITKEDARVPSLGACIAFAASGATVTLETSVPGVSRSSSIVTSLDVDALRPSQDVGGDGVQTSQ